MSPTENQHLCSSVQISVDLQLWGDAHIHPVLEYSIAGSHSVFLILSPDGARDTHFHTCFGFVT